MKTDQTSTFNIGKPSIVKKRKRVRKPGTKRPLGVRIGIVLFIAAIILAVWKLWACLNISDPYLNYLNVTKNGEALVLLNGETAHFHPSDILKITDLSTNLCFNRGVRVVSKGLDADSLLYDEVLLADLLPNEDIYSNYTFRLEVKKYNQEMGYVDFVVEPRVEDWLDKADRTIENERKIEVLKRAQEIFPEEGVIKDRLVKEYISQKKWKDAAGLLEDMLEEKSDQENLTTLLNIYENMSNSIGAISVLRKMIDLTPDDTDLKLKLAKALDNSGRSTEAVNTYEGLLKSLKGRELLQAYTSLGYLYAEKGNNKKAISSYLKALELNKDDVNIYHNLSLLYEKTGQKEKANQYLSKVVELKPDSQDERLKLARNLLEGGKLEDAEKSLEEFIEHNPRSMDAWLLMARIAEKTGDKTSLKTSYEKILDINPQNSTVIYNLGIMEYEAGNQDKAVAYLERYVKFSPDDSSAHLFLFETYKDRKQEDKAFQEASSVVSIEPDETECWQYIYEYLNKKERYDEIASLMEQGIKKRPNDLNLRKYLIAVYLKTGKTNKAITQMNAAIDLDPKDADMLLQLARLYEKQDMPNEALACYKKVLDILPDNEEAQKAYMRLRLKTIKE